MVGFGDLFSRTDRKDMARIMYTRALPGYIAAKDLLRNGVVRSKVDLGHCNLRRLTPRLNIRLQNPERPSQNLACRDSSADGEYE